MRWPIALVLSGFFASAACADPIGVFSSTSGNVQVLRGKNYLAAAPGVDVVPEDIVETGQDSSAQLDMDDGSVLMLGPETRLALSDYQVDAKRNVVSAALDVLSGWMRFAVAKLRPDGQYNIHTPVLTIGIRGTEGTIEAQNEQGGLHLSEGIVDVAPIGNDAAAFKPVRVNGGEYIQRARGQAFARFSQPPVAFQKRVPPMLRQRLIHRAHELRSRGVPPRVIRKMTREDAQRFMERHPHMRERWRRRFGEPAADRDETPRHRRQRLGYADVSATEGIVGQAGEAVPEPRAQWTPQEMRRQEAGAQPNS